MRLDEVEAVLRGLSLPMLVLSRDGAVLASNRAVCQLLSTAPEQLHGRLLALEPGSSEAFGEYLRLCVRSTEPLPGSVRLVGAGGGTMRLRCEGSRLVARVPDRVGGVVLLHVRGDEGGLNPFVLLTEKVSALTVEVRRRQCIEVALRESEARFRRLVEMVPQLVWMSRPDGSFEYLNPRCLEYAGLDLEGSRHGGLRKVLHPEDQRRTLLAWLRSLRTGVPFERELRLRCASDGGWRWFLARAAPMRDATGHVKGWFGTCTDIQEQRHAIQEAVEALGVRDDFLSMAAHELKTPLSSLKLQVQLLSRSLGRADAVPEQGLGARLRRLDRQIDRLDALNNSLLDVSRIRAGKLVLALERVDLTQRIRDVLEQVEVEAARTGGELRLELQPDVVGCWDGLRLEQVVLNLVGNALKYGQGRPVEVSLRADEDSAVLAVRDHGIGIPAEEHDRIFRKFERAVGARHYGGLGLGLYICRQIVESLAGTITVESSPGVGACFQVRLPRVPPHASCREPVPA